MPRGKKTDPHNPYKPNFNYVILKLLSKAFDKGQLFYMAFGLVIVIGGIKIPGEDILPFIEKMFTLSEKYSILGWILFVLTVLLSTLAVKQLRKSHKSEMDRISESKTELQNHLSGIELSSSNQET